MRYYRRGSPEPVPSSLSYLRSQESDPNLPNRGSSQARSLSETHLGGARPLGVSTVQSSSILGTLRDAVQSPLALTRDTTLHSSINTPSAGEHSTILQSSKTVLLGKLNWANRRLDEETNVQANTDLVVLVREIVQTLQTFHSARF